MGHVKKSINRCLAPLQDTKKILIHTWEDFSGSREKLKTPRSDLILINGEHFNPLNVTQSFLKTGMSQKPKIH